MTKKNALRKQVAALEKLAGLTKVSERDARKVNGGRRHHHKTSNSVTLALGSGAVAVRKGSGHMLVSGGSGALVWNPGSGSVAAIGTGS